ncbi:4Fe-4S dicluster domain-containing protein [Geovibrio ferrireducens]|uniref:4Fe-4S dicluster domain-containing protein n=1 Tax=Geovibrio ferrireducens TaxID=46201 RepID=UPI00224699F3|nr:4Fe-4S dicluster domain-containing protein [Geovibrio ferrireducens]
MSQKGFYFDQTRCVACDTCLVACKSWNMLNAGPASWRKRVENEIGGYPNLKIYQLTMSCNHCAEPSCVKVCPMGAIYKRESDGVVIVDRASCIACKSCLAACPFGAPQFADDDQEPVKKAEWSVKHPMQKCTACWDRTAIDKLPACAGACPHRAIDFGELTELNAKYPDAVKSVTGFPDPAYGANGNKLDKSTEPSILFKRK